MLYLKLIFRGIFRHKKRSLKFFALLTVCFMMTIFSLSFQDSFYEEYVDLGINARNAHINIFPPESVWLKNSFTSIQKEGMPLLEIDDEFNKFINGLSEVEVGTPIIETGGAFYTKEGKMQSGGTITGVKASDFRRIFPGIELIKGMDDITVKPESDNIPFLRWDVQNNEKIQNIDIFVPEDFKSKGAKLEDFKSKISKDFPILFTSNNYQGQEGTEKFINQLNNILEREDLYSNVPEYYTEKYDFNVVNIIKQIKNQSFENESELKNWNKRLIQTIYPEDINEVPEGIALNKPMGLFVASTDDTRPPILIPIEFIGYCEGIPEFYGYNFIELKVLQEYIDVSNDKCTSYLIRLKDEKDLGVVMTKVDNYIKERGFDYKVVDYKYIGNKTHIPLATGVSIVFRSLIILFLLISIFFVSYIVTISLIRRRKEMGTVITLGMSRNENILVFLGENLVLITVSWIAASMLMGLLLIYLSKNGLGGIVFFPRGILHFKFKYEYFTKAYLVITIPGILASIFPALKLRKATLVELLKGEISKRKRNSNNKLRGNFGSSTESSFVLMLKLAVRNIFANKRRNVVIFVIFALVVTILHLFLAYGDGVVSNFRNGFQALDNPRSDIIATKKGYADLYKINANSDELKDMPIIDYEEIHNEILKMDFVKDAYIKTVPVNLDMFVNESRFKNLSFRGVDSSMFDYLTSKVDIVEGRMLESQDENGILINIVNKPELKANVGDTTTALGSDLFNHVITEDFKIVGYYRPKIDTPFFTSLVFTDIHGYNAVSGYLSNEVNFLNINIEKGESLVKRVSQLNEWAASNGLDIEFNEFGKIYVQDDEKYGTGRKMIMMLTYLVIFFVMIGIINMILINLYDRRKEIGTYYCIGAEKSLLIGVYTLELLIINVIATTVGVAIGLGLQRFINSLKISSSNPGIQIAFGGSVFYLDFNPISTVMLFVSVVVITLVISLVSLRSSLKVSPIMALQEMDE